MNNLMLHIENYLDYCKNQKGLDSKTLKAYRIDLRQFSAQNTADISDISSSILEDYIATLHKKYKPRTAKRKIASLRALFHYFEYREIIYINPFNKLHIRFREPVILPKTIPLYAIERILSTIYHQHNYARTFYQKRRTLRDAAVLELLFATGIRVSELCSLHIDDVNLQNRTILIYGKGARERIVQIGNDDVTQLLNEYKTMFLSEIQHCNHFFVNLTGTPLSSQSVRRMIKKYTSLSALELHITPHMFRHTFASSLLEADVDIRYIQKMLGHSSIHTTEIYTHVSMSKQRDILSTKHPRNNFNL